MKAIREILYATAVVAVLLSTSCAIVRGPIPHPTWYWSSSAVSQRANDEFLEWLRDHPNASQEEVEKHYENPYAP